MNDQAQPLLEDLLNRLMVTFERIEQDEREGMVRFNIITDDPAILIGRRGDTLFSVQQILRLILRKQEGVSEGESAWSSRIIVDVNDYRRNQEKNAELIARDTAERVRESGEPRELAPMPSYKRRAVHTFFAQPDYGDLYVYSVGEGEDRRIHIEMKKE